MTTQIQDRLIFQAYQYHIIGVNGKGLLSPINFGIVPVSMGSNCRRGYYSEYSCINERLVLTAITLRTDDRDEYEAYKEIEGVFPAGDPECFVRGRYYAYKYSNLKVPALFSGGLLTAKDYIEKINVAEFPESYETVIELIFNDGQLEKSIDHSGVAEQYRKDAFQKKISVHHAIQFTRPYDLFYAHHIEDYTI